MSLEPDGCLSYLGNVFIPPTAELVVNEKFRIGESGIGMLGSSFLSKFSNKREASLGPSLSCYYRVRVTSSCNLVVAALGYPREETALAKVFSLLSFQSRGQEGALHTNGFPNIFFIRRDANGYLDALDVRWYGRTGVWILCLCEPQRIIEICVGSRVFSSIEV